MDPTALLDLVDLDAVPERGLGFFLVLAALLLGALLLGFNLWTFPIPPEAAGTIDWGPFCALWMLVAYVLLLRAARSHSG